MTTLDPSLFRRTRSRLLAATRTVARGGNVDPTTWDEWRTLASAADTAPILPPLSITVGDLQNPRSVWLAPVVPPPADMWTQVQTRAAAALGVPANDASFRAAIESTFGARDRVAKLPVATLGAYVAEALARRTQTLPVGTLDGPVAGERERLLMGRDIRCIAGPVPIDVVRRESAVYQAVLYPTRNGWALADRAKKADGSTVSSGDYDAGAKVRGAYFVEVQTHVRVARYSSPDYAAAGRRATDYRWGTLCDRPEFADPTRPGNPPPPPRREYDAPPERRTSASVGVPMAAIGAGLQRVFGSREFANPVRYRSAVLGNAIVWNEVAVPRNARRLQAVLRDNPECASREAVAAWESVFQAVRRTSDTIRAPAAIARAEGISAADVVLGIRNTAKVASQLQAARPADALANPPADVTALLNLFGGSAAKTAINSATRALAALAPVLNFVAVIGPILATIVQFLAEYARPAVACLSPWAPPERTADGWVVNPEGWRDIPIAIITTDGLGRPWEPRA